MAFLIISFHKTVALF